MGIPRAARAIVSPRNLASGGGLPLGIGPMPIHVWKFHRPVSDGCVALRLPSLVRGVIVLGILLHFFV